MNNYIFNKNSLLLKIFEVTYKIGTKLLDISGNVILVFVGILGLIVGSFIVNQVPIVFFIILCLFYFSIFISISPKILLSLRGFIFTGILYWLIITFLLMGFLNNMFGMTSIWLDYLVISFSWCFYSLLANNKVATIANQIYSTILALLTIMKDAIIYSIPETFLNRVDASGNTYGRVIEICIGKILYPVLAINLVALLLCSLKGYWITKYNDGKDLEYPNSMD